MAENRSPSRIPVFQRPPAQGSLLVARAVLQNTLQGPHLSGDGILVGMRGLPLNGAIPALLDPSALSADYNTRGLVLQASMLFAQALLQDTAQFVGPQLPADVFNVYNGHRVLRDYPIMRDGRPEIMAGAVVQASSIAQSYCHKTAQLQIMPGWLALEAGRTVEAERRLQRILFQRFVLQQGVGRVVAPSLALLAASNPTQLTATQLAISYANAHEDAAWRFDVEMLGVVGLTRLHGNGVPPSGR